MLEGFSYCPTLHSRVAEIKALFQLPAATKDRLFPLIVGRPWPNARRLERTWEKVNEALGGRRYALDLDRTRRNSGSASLVAAEFDALFDSTHGFANYYTVVESLGSVLPVLRVSGGEAVGFDEQVQHIERIDRGLVVRIEYGILSNPFALVDNVLMRFDDVVIFIDAGWSSDLLGREAWTSEIVRRVIERRQETELVVSGSSFPESFTNIEERGIIPVRERYLYSNIVRRHNAANVIYGDWGSTRPPSDPTLMRNIPRIDLPTSREWISFRRDSELDDSENYGDIAQRVISDPAWPADLKIWGTYAITSTASDLPGAIRSPAAPAAARINIHLHRQAFFGIPEPAGDEDEPFTDC